MSSEQRLLVVSNRLPLTAKRVSGRWRGERSSGGLVAAMASGGRERDRLDDLAGLARSRPGTAALMTLFMLSLAAVPGTAGFMARFHLLRAAVAADLVWLGLVAVVTSAIGLYACLRIPAAMYMRESTDDVPAAVDTFAGIALAACAAGVLWLGLFPDHGAVGALDLIETAATALGP